MQVMLRELLDKNEKSIYWLRKETGITQAALSNLCNNKTNRIDFSVLDKICIALDCKPNDILIPKHQMALLTSEPNNQDDTSK